MIKSIDFGFEADILHEKKACHLKISQTYTKSAGLRPQIDATFSLPCV
jgi:hypothetical protein